MSWDPRTSLSPLQLEQLQQFGEALARVNRKINLVSRTSVAHLEERHVLHALALTRRRFPAGTTVVDWGAGGGLPSIPLAIAFPDVFFVAVDAVGKKMQAVRMMAREIGLTNVEAWHGRAEAWDGTATHSVSRATAQLATLWQWHERIARAAEPLTDEFWAPGLITLKGGDLNQEVQDLQTRYPALHVEREDLFGMLKRDYFAEKGILTVVDSSQVGNK